MTVKIRHGNAVTSDRRGPIPYTNTVSAAEFDPPISWIYIASVGSGGLVVKDEAGTTRTFTSAHLFTGLTLFGPFSEITSTTCTAILAGDGLAPKSTLLNSAPATSSALGSVKLSAAPADGAAPIVVVSTDKRVTTIEALVSFSGSDGSLTEQPFPHPAFACTLADVSVASPADAAGDDTNYVTITLGKRDGAGGSATTLVAGTTKATGGVNEGVGLAAFEYVSLGTPSATAIAATDVLTIKSAKTAAGVAIGPSIVRMTFTVP